MKKSYCLLIISCMLVMLACRKETFITGSGAEILTSSDTLHFDTLFTSTGSVTHFFKLFNNNDQKLRISSISLGGGAGSYYQINADGFPGPEISNIEMEANDSLYVFVTVKIDPSSANLPFVVEDSVRIAFDGNERWVQLQAWGQNANFYRSRLITGNTTWTKDKPYVIMEGLLVDRNAVLTIEKGTHIYLHADAPFLVDGTLRANGEKYDSTKIIFRGDRLDDPYKDYPGGWPGIYFRSTSKNNLLHHVTVKNAYQGIVAEGPSVNTNPKLTMQQCVVDNCYDVGVSGVQSDIEASNCLISNCGKNILLLKGGKYSFTQCTDVAYSNSLISHQQPVLAVTDYILDGNDIVSAELNANFVNCIFWGENSLVEDEVVVVKKGSGIFNVSFINCLWKIKTEPADISISGMIANEDPLFEKADTRENQYDFHPGENSPVIDKGIITGIDTDLDDNPRNGSFPDLGAFERQ